MSPMSPSATAPHLIHETDDPTSALPPAEALRQLGEALMTELLDLVLGTPLEDWSGAICGSFIGGLHVATQRIERDADRARDRLAIALRDFDGSEVADTDLQEAQVRCQAADAAVEAVEAVRDAAAAAYATATGDTWSPWRGGVRPTPTTAAQMEARMAIRTREERRRKASDPGDTVVALRASPRSVAPLDGMRIFDALNWAHAQWPGMSLAITGAPGGEHIARRWAAQKRVPLILARPDFGRHGRRAPFRANDDLMALEPVCVLTLARSLEDGRDPEAFGPVLNLIDQAQRAGARLVRISPARAGAG